MQCWKSVGLLGMCMSAVAAQAQVLYECVHDANVQTRFIPVEMMTGEAFPATDVLQLQPVDRRYPFVFVRKGESPGEGETVLKGPVNWTGAGGKTYEVYERNVPKAFERVALTPDGTAMGRVYDERIGNVTNEGKFPVGLWKQGEKRSYSTTLHLPPGDRTTRTQIEIEKLACTYNGIEGALQIRWTNDRGLNYVYIFAPGKGLVQVANEGR